jgi:uncharacterized protein YdhG (YjbR/CyaY superfamily)
MPNKNSGNEVDKYIAGFQENIQKLLKQLRSIIMKAAPGAEEVISYKMPAYKYNGILVFFAAYPNHIGFYPTPSAIEKFKAELSVFKSAKGSVQFPLDKPLPAELISNIVSFKVIENTQKAGTALKKKKQNLLLLI